MSKLEKHYQKCVDHYSKASIKALKSENIKEFVYLARKADMYATFLKNRGVI